MKVQRVYERVDRVPGEDDDIPYLHMEEDHRTTLLEITEELYAELGYPASLTVTIESGDWINFCRNCQAELKNTVHTWLREGKCRILEKKS